MPLSRPVISRVAPLNVGGAANAGAGFLASAFDHAHPLTETSGPTDLTPGSIIDTDSVRRIGALLVGQQFDVIRQGNNINSTSTTLVDAGSFVFAVRRTGQYEFAFFLHYASALVTTGLQLAVGFTGTASIVRYSLLEATSPTAMQSGSSGAFGGVLGAPGVGPANTTVAALLYGSANVTAPGTLSLQVASGVAGSNVTISSNSWGVLIQQ